MNFKAAQHYIITRLDQELNKNLHYHNIEHTLDTHKAVIRLIELEKLDAYSAQLIETAALYHDAGMLYTYQDHELKSAEIARKILPTFEYTSQEIEEIVDMIMTTRLPQSATTTNQKILCDADLDAIGREDFFITSMRLHLEWKLFNIKPISLAEWIDFEIEFLENHSYYTNSARFLRDEQKLKNIEELKKLVK